MKAGTKTNWLPVACVVAVLVKLLLCAIMPLDVHANAAYDDAWAVRAADFLTQGEWLGPYDDITLIKNIGFPLWLAACKATGVGYLMATALLYAFASAVFALAVRPLIKRDWLFFVLFVLILFCPVSIATDTYQRIYRNSITAAQALLVFAAYLGCYVRAADTLPVGELRVRSFAPWMVLGVFALPWFWLSREDSIWIAPFVAVATAVLLAMLGRAVMRSKKATAPVNTPVALACAVLLCVPLVATAASIQAVKATNEAHYGVAVTAEINTGNFARMVKDLYAIDPAQTPSAGDAQGGMPENQRVAVTHAALMSAYEASPTLASMKELVEEQFAWGDTIDNNPGDGEVNGGEFFWTLRRAARDAGAYGTDETARAKLVRVMAANARSGEVEEADALLSLQPAQFVDALYAHIADELEAALAGGALPQRATMPSSIMTPWRAEYGAQLLPTAASIVAEAFGYGDVTCLPFAAQGSEDGIEYFETMTLGIAYRGSAEVPAACTLGEWLVALYRVLGLVLGICGVVGFFVVLWRWGRQFRAGSSARMGDVPCDCALGPLVLVLIALALGVFVLVAGLTYSRVSSFIPITFYYYGSAAYPLLLAWAVLAAGGAFEAWRDGRADRE